MQLNSPFRLIIVDESPVVRRSLVSFLAPIENLEFAGEAGDAEEALRMVRDDEPDAVVLEVQAEGASGTGLLEAIKKANPATAVIMFSQHASPALRRCFLSAGADYYFSKSGEYRQLYALLASLASGEAFAFQPVLHSEPHAGTNPDWLYSEKVRFERKTFFLDLKENNRGRFLKFTEDVSGRRDTVLIPADAFKEIAAALQRIIEFEELLARDGDRKNGKAKGASFAVACGR